MSPVVEGERRIERRIGRPAFALPAAVVLLLFLCLSPCHAQGQLNDVTYTRQSFFRIPFQIDPGGTQLREVALWVSTDEGRSWHAQGNAPPERRYFDFTTNKDGVFWFAVRTTDMNGVGYPMNAQSLRPSLKVCVDTQPPVITLQAQQPRDGMVGVDWEIRETNLDPNGTRLDYHLPGTSEWLPLAVQPAAKGEHSWKPATNGALEVRLQARDRAGNTAEQMVTVIPSGQPAQGSSPVPAAGAPAVRMVNSKRISLNYDVKDVGKSGLSVVELWYTQDGRNWQKYGENPRSSPPYIFEVNDEGLYGFTLSARSGVGLGERPPQVGDPPQIWVEVDLTKPIVRLLGVDVGRNSDAGNLTITWSATDKNLGRQPVTLSYAEKLEGPWSEIAANIENTGRYVWHMPENLPYQFFVRVEAKDRAGNVGSAETDKQVKVDLSMPKPHILDVAPAK